MAPAIGYLEALAGENIFFPQLWACIQGRTRGAKWVLFCARSSWLEGGAAEHGEELEEEDSEAFLVWAREEKHGPDEGERGRPGLC